MPRGRFLSKSISLDEKVNALSSDTARLLFTWLISHLDCEGRLHGDATTVKSIVFPRRPMHTKTVEQYLNEMEKLGLIRRYNINGNTYLFAPHFEKHQVGLQKNKEAQSQIPPPAPELLQSNTRVDTEKVSPKYKLKYKLNIKYIHILFSHWNDTKIIQHTKLTDKVKRALETAINEYDLEVVQTAITNYGLIVNDPQYYFKYKWTLVDFLKRGLEKFADLEVAKSNYLKDDKNGKTTAKALPTEKELEKGWG